MICWAETVVQKLKSEHTWYSKNKILETSNQMRDFAFQKTIAPPPKNNRNKQIGKMIEDELKQICYQHDYTESEKKYQKERIWKNAFSLP